MTTIQSKWVWPSLIALSALIAGSLAFTNSAIAVRPLAAIWFLLVCPGMAFVRLLPIKEMAVQWTLAVALSLAVDAMVAAVLVYMHVWSPNIAFVILIAASLVGASLQVIPERRLGVRKIPEKSLGAEEDLWYRKVITMDSTLATYLISETPATPQASVKISLKSPKMKHSRILLVDSDGIISAKVRNFMQESGYEMLCVKNEDEAQKVVATSRPDLILLDIRLPSVFGWDSLNHLREKSSVPIIVLTANHEDADILHGFHLGADDYLMKPFPLVKLEARVAAVLTHSRAIHSSNNRMTSGELTIDFKRKQVISNRQKVKLTPTEYRLLETLARHANRTVPLSWLRTEVWGSSHEGKEDSYRRFIRSMRKKIEADPSHPMHLITRRGFGYRFE